MFNAGSIARSVLPAPSYSVQVAGDYVISEKSTIETVEPFPLACWYANFARPQMAAWYESALDEYDLKLAYGTTDETISLIWETEDAWGHPLSAYTCTADYTGFSWTFEVDVPANVQQLDATYGLTLTVVMNDTTQHIVRLWNYKTTGTAASARFILDFSNIASGFFAETPFTPDDVDYMFFTVTHADYGTATKFSDYDYATVTIRHIAGAYNPALSLVRRRTPAVLEHSLGMTFGYDDVYGQDPKRLAEQTYNLGYRGFVTCYVGMSHFTRLGWDASEARYRYFDTFNADPVNDVTKAWFLAFETALNAYGMRLIYSVSYELFWDYCPLVWAQRNYLGDPAQTGWSPPSTLLAFTQPDVKAFLANTAKSFADIFPTGTFYYQVGEPWWWDGFFTDGRPCFYDDYTKALFLAEHGYAMYEFQDSSDAVDTPQKIETASWLGDQLGTSTLEIQSALKAHRPDTKACILFFTPQAFSRPLMTYANYPQSDWQFPNWDFFQLEAYDEAIEADHTTHNEQVMRAMSELQYPRRLYQYFAGFVLNAVDAATLWPRITSAANFVASRHVGQISVWSFSQVARDGVIYEEA